MHNTLYPVSNGGVFYYWLVTPHPLFFDPHQCKRVWTLRL